VRVNSAQIKIGARLVGIGHPVYIIAEMSANHGQSFDQATEIIRVAKEAGADAVKFQTYTPDTLTIDCDREPFRIGKGSLWAGRKLYDLYKEAFTPWEWQPRLKALADELGLDCFSTPFDGSAIEFLEAMEVPAHKVASFEIVDLALIRRIAQTRKPVVMSTGMASLSEIDEAVRAFREAGGTQLALLKCTSAYPAVPDEMNLRTIPHLAAAFGVPTGLSDHTLDSSVAVAAVVLGACIIEKHLTMARSAPGPDSAFSLEPQEFKAMVQAIRTAEKALGTVNYEVTEKENVSRIFRRSLFAVEDVSAGELFTEKNVRSIRPGHGLAPRYLPHLIGRAAKVAIKRGTPLTWDLVS
jgi:pseudaminic acid synthase